MLCRPDAMFVCLIGRLPKGRQVGIPFYGMFPPIGGWCWKQPLLGSWNSRLNLRTEQTFLPPKLPSSNTYITIPLSVQNLEGWKFVNLERNLVFPTNGSIDLRYILNSEVL